MISHILYKAAIAKFAATSMKPILPIYVAIWFPDKIYNEYLENIDKNAFVKSICFCVIFVCISLRHYLILELGLVELFIYY